MEAYLNGIDEDLRRSINKGPFLPEMLVNLGATTTNDDMITQGNKIKVNDKKCLYELRSALPPVLCNYVRACSTAKHIWDTLKENYQGNGKINKSSIKQCVLELGEFKQNETESIESYYNGLNELIFKSSHYGVIRSTLESNLTFSWAYERNGDTSG